MNCIICNDLMSHTKSKFDLVDDFGCTKCPYYISYLKDEKIYLFIKINNFRFLSLYHTTLGYSETQLEIEDERDSSRYKTIFSSDKVFFPREISLKGVQDMISSLTKLSKFQ